MIPNQPDAFGVYGDLLRFSVLFAMVSGALVIFLYLWKKDRLDMDEEPKKRMMEMDDRGSQ